MPTFLYAENVVNNCYGSPRELLQNQLGKSMTENSNRLTPGETVLSKQPMKILNIWFFLIALLFIVSCKRDNQPRIKEGIAYPDLISPIYYIDTFQINSPRIAYIDSVPYIFSLENMVPFKDKDDFLKQKGVIRFLTHHIHSIRTIYYLGIYEDQNWQQSFQYLMTQNDFYFEEMFVPGDSIKDIPVYKFAFEPDKFLLTLFSSIDSVVTAYGHDDSILDILYTKDYTLALAPIYTKQDLKKINNLWFRQIHGRDINWRDYL